MFSILMSALLGAAPQPSATATLRQAEAAYGLFDVPKAERLYTNVLSDPSATPIEAAMARRELARIAWLVDGDAERAEALLAQDLRAEPKLCPSVHLLARIRAEASTPFPSRLANLAKACVEVEPGAALERVRQLTRMALAAPPERRARFLAGAVRELDALPAAARTSVLGNNLRLSLGVHQRDARTAIAGWRAYFWLEPGQSAPQALQGLGDAAVIFRRGLDRMATGQDRDALLTLLMRAGFFDLVEQLRAEGYVATDPAVVRRLDAYARLRHELGSAILAHDRRFARAGVEPDEAGYERALSAILARAAETVAPGTTDVAATLYREFGLWGTKPGRSNGVSGIHLGHVVIDERQRVAQGAREGAIRLIAIDNMIHNSFSAWLMDGRSATGGWAVDGATIVQVRPRYLQLIDGYARLAQGGVARREADAEAAALAADDRELARAERVAFLPGLRARLRLQGIDALAANVRTRAAATGFELTFRRAYWDAMIASSITAHEGRHVLDQASFPGACALPDAELEYRAKLSELRYAPVPRLALSSIYSPLFGGTSGHGVANRRLAAALVDWVEANSAQLPGYDPARTALEQLDLLTDEQLVAIASALEPDGPACPTVSR